MSNMAIYLILLSAADDTILGITFLHHTLKTLFTNNNMIND